MEYIQQSSNELYNSNYTWNETNFNSLNKNETIYDKIRANSVKNFNYEDEKFLAYKKKHRDPVIDEKFSWIGYVDGSYKKVGAEKARINANRFMLSGYQNEFSGLSNDEWVNLLEDIYSGLDMNQYEKSIKSIDKDWEKAKTKLYEEAEDKGFDEAKVKALEKIKAKGFEEVKDRVFEKARIAKKRNNRGMKKLKECYYNHLKNLSKKYGTSLEKLAPIDFFKKYGADAFKKDFSWVQDCRGLMKIDQLFDFENNEEDKELKALCSYYSDIGGGIGTPLYSWMNNGTFSDISSDALSDRKVDSSILDKKEFRKNKKSALKYIKKNQKNPISGINRKKKGGRSK